MGGGDTELLMAVSLLNYIAYMISLTSWGLNLNNAFTAQQVWRDFGVGK